ncbi:MAG: hypothetical protein M3Y17_05585 [Actinomycetota bacterium]|nr:hypothetical protein [Actinomycetota bacterium]
MTSQAERDKLRDATTRAHHAAETQREKEFEARQTDVLKRERALAEQHLVLLAQNTKLTEEIARLTTELHATFCSETLPGSAQSGPRNSFVRGDRGGVQQVGQERGNADSARRALELRFGARVQLLSDRNGKGNRQGGDDGEDR